MAIYTTFFVCKPVELPSGFPGWRLPLEKPVCREVRNPFTGVVSIVETREPEWPEVVGAEPEPEYGVVEIEGSYEDYLEGRLPSFVRACPHWALKRLTEIELDPLIKAVNVAAGMEYAIYSPPLSAAVVQRFPPSFLAELDSSDQTAVAGRWAAAMSAPEHTHSVTGAKLSEGWSTDDALGLIRPLVALARQATAGQQLYLLIEA